MSEYRVAVRYAKSILDLAQERGVLDEVYRDMEFFEQLCLENPKLAAVLKNPIIYSYKKLAILKGLLSDKLHPLTISFFEIIAKKNREEILFATAKEFENQYEQYKGIQRAEVQTTFPLNDALRQEILEMLAKSTGKQIRLSEKVNPALIGGLVITVAGEQVDASVAGKLKQIKTALEHAS